MPSPRYHREIPARYRLEAGRCNECGKVSYPTRMVCPACGAREFERLGKTRTSAPERSRAHHGRSHPPALSLPSLLPGAQASVVSTVTPTPQAARPSTWAATTLGMPP